MTAATMTKERAMDLSSPYDDDDLRKKILKQLEGKTEDELREVVVKAFSLSVESILRAALAIGMLEKMGKPFKPDEIPNLHHFRRIASGQVVPELLCRFARRTSLVTKVGNFPLPDQKRLADGEPVPLVVMTPDGKEYTHRMVDPASLSGPQVAQVFGPDHIRSIAEQSAIIDQRRAEAAKPAPNVVIRGQRRPKGIIVNGLFCPIAEVQAALRAIED